MATLSIRIPTSIHRSLKEFAADEQTSINTFVVSAILEKITALETEEYLEKRAAKGNEEEFLRVLNKVPDTIPLAGDA